MFDSHYFSGPGKLIQLFQNISLCVLDNLMQANVPPPHLQTNVRKGCVHTTLKFNTELTLWFQDSPILEWDRREGPSTRVNLFTQCSIIKVN